MTLRMNAIYYTFIRPIFLNMLHLTPNEMNAPMTLPAMVAKPPVITAWISDFVMSIKYGRISSGASVWWEKQRIKERKDTMFLNNTVLSDLPNKYIACNAQGLCGRGSHCYLHQPWDLHKTQNTWPFITIGGLQEPTMLCCTSFNLQNDPLHYSQKVKDRHDAAEENHNGQSLRKETKLVAYI